MRGLQVLEAQSDAGLGFAREWVMNMSNAQRRGHSQEMHVQHLENPWQRRWLFALIAGVIVLLIVVIALLLEQRYTAETQVLVESREQVLSDIQAHLQQSGNHE